MELARRAGGVATSVKFYGQIEVIIGIIGVRVDGFLKIVGSAFPVRVRAYDSRLL